MNGRFGRAVAKDKFQLKNRKGWWECKMVQLLGRTVWRFLQKLNIDLLCDPAIPLLGGYPKELKVETQIDTYTPLFTEALFPIAKKWKQTKCPSMDEWINKHVMYTCNKI